jgi:tRNA-specific 2-thiouridylase
MKKRIVVGMSGGVDSSVSALLLKQQGFEVIGLFMKNWEESDENGVCKASQEYADVVKVCQQLEIPHYSVNFTKEYQREVFAYFLKELEEGFTPNPDILCNREIKFKVLLEKALSLGAHYLATGHYVRIQDNQLQKGRDLHKDQSYFLYTLQANLLDKLLFPIGDLEKQQVRQIAHCHGLATADKKESTGICFIGERNFKQFIHQYLPFQPGNFENLKGEVIGRHDGCAFYTIGQRRGLKIGGRGGESLGEAWFVTGKDIKRNVVLIEQGGTHPSLYSQHLTASDLSWVNAPPSLPLSCTAKIRYRQADQPCVIEKIEEGVASVSFQTPQRAITPRQAVVFYDGETCLGGGLISHSC